MNMTTRAQRINKRQDAIWDAYLAQIWRMGKDTQAQEKRDSGHPDAGTGQSESKPN